MRTTGCKGMCLAWWRGRRSGGVALGAHGWGGLACGSGSSQQGSRGRGRSMAQGPLARVAQGLRAAAWGSGSGSSRLIHSTHSAIATAQILPPTCSYYPNMLQHAPTLCCTTSPQVLYGASAPFTLRRASSATAGSQRCGHVP